MLNYKTVALAIATAALSLPTSVHAQSSSGNIVGDAKTGQTVIVTSPDNGFKREMKIEKDGKFQIRRVPTGDYQVVRLHADGSIDPVQQLVVRPGGTARVMNVGNADAQDTSTGS